MARLVQPRDIRDVQRVSSGDDIMVETGDQAAGTAAVGGAGEPAFCRPSRAYMHCIVVTYYWLWPDTLEGTSLRNNGHSKPKCLLLTGYRLGRQPDGTIGILTIRHCVAGAVVYPRKQLCDEPQCNGTILLQV